MALRGHLISKHVKCWFNRSMTCTDVSTQRFCRFFSNQSLDTGAVDNPLIQEAAITQESRVRDNEPKTFEELFKKSAFVSLGNPRGKFVVGTIKKVVDDSVYIDFGWKFPCVCPLPSQGTGSYVPGRKVRLMIKELEIASKFLGSDKEITLNEADCVLFGLYKPQSVITGPRQNEQRPATKIASESSEKTATVISDLFQGKETSDNNNQAEKTKE